MARRLEGREVVMMVCYAESSEVGVARGTGKGGVGKAEGSYLLTSHCPLNSSGQAGHKCVHLLHLPALMSKVEVCHLP